MNLLVVMRHFGVCRDLEEVDFLVTICVRHRAGVRVKSACGMSHARVRVSVRGVVQMGAGRVKISFTVKIHFGMRIRLRIEIRLTVRIGAEAVRIG